MSATQLECLSLRRLPVFLVLVLVLAICTPAWLQAAEEGAQGKCGSMGTFDLKPPDWIGHKEPPPGPVTWWKDTDGVDPGKAGCHLGLASEHGDLNGRMFSEYCRPEDGLLVESNPDPGVPHSHKNDIGHPDTFDCQKWCACQKFAKGTCVVAVPEDPLCKGQDSAKCACSN